MTALTLDSQWQVDLDNATVTFIKDSETFTYPVQLIGSIAQSAGTWMWGWQSSHEDRLPGKALQLAKLVHDRGVSLDIPELKTPVITLSDTPSLVLRLAAEALGGGFHTLTVDAGRGLTLLFAVDMGPLRPLSGQELVDVTMQGADLGVTENHLDALECYARHVGLDYSVTSHDPLTAAIGSQAGGIEIETDESGRLVSLREQPVKVQRRAS
ncbi:DUF6882 domain-containing protein [Gulosibacter molinativorax]|nr:DUF6882 domain-containing protein [Gulosibacter molinativorax]